MSEVLLQVLGMALGLGLGAAVLLSWYRLQDRRDRRNRVAALDRLVDELDAEDERRRLAREQG